MRVLTRAQREAIKRKFDQNSDGAMAYRRRKIGTGWWTGMEPSYLVFRRRVKYTHFMDGCIMLRWCGMWLGIETDGYTHS